MDAPTAAQGSGKHIVLVHGACLGGWSWFKVATPLRAAGYRVDTPDLAASGVDPRPLREVPTFRDYTQPLLDLLASLPDGERVVLVGHSLGGVNVALAAETFPDKIAAVVFLCAFMPDCTARPSHVLEKFVEGQWLDWMDTEMKPQDAEGKLPTSMMFGPRIIRERFFQLCKPEDITLAASLMRVSSMFVEDLVLQQPYTPERYGSVRKVYIVCTEDLAIVEPFQRWMVENNPVDEVKEIEADHVVMLSRPDELVRCLTDIANKFIFVALSRRPVRCLNCLKGPCVPVDHLPLSNPHVRLPIQSINWLTDEEHVLDHTIDHLTKLSFTRQSGWRQRKT